MDPCSTLLLLSLSMPCVQDVADVRPVVEQIQPHLEDAGDLAPLVTALTSGGPEWVEGLARLLDHGEVRGEWRSDGGSTVRLTSALDAALLAALALRPRSELEPLFDSAREAAEDQRPRRTALRLLGEIGGSKDVSLLIQIASPPPESGGVSRDLRVAFEQSLGRVLERAPEGRWVLRDRFTSIGGSLLAPAIRCISRERSEESLELLAGILGRVAGADALILRELARVGDALHHPVGRVVQTSVRFKLSDPDPFVTVLAIEAAGSLGDHDSIPQLISHLSHEEPLVREAADDALSRLTARKFRGDRDAWQAWYYEELDWWAEESSRCFQGIRSADAALAVRAIRDVSSRRLHVDDLSREVAWGLNRTQPEIVRLTAAALGALGSSAVMGDLVRALDHADEGVVRAAHAALCRITRLDIEPDSDAWSATL